MHICFLWDCGVCSACGHFSMCTNNNSEYVGLSSGTAHFQHELSLDEFSDSKEFTFTGSGKESLTCDLSLCGEIRCSKQYKARCCPLSFACWHDQTLYLQQHQNSSVKLTPALSDLGIESIRKNQLEFKQVIPIARHRQDFHLLQFELKSQRATDEVDNLFMSISPDGSSTCVFTKHSSPFLDVLACSMAMKEAPLLACLFSYNEEFRRVNTLSLEVFQKDASLTESDCSEIPWLSRIHTVPVYLYCVPSVLLPVILHHPLAEDTKLVCFNINGKQSSDNEKCSSSGISEVDWMAKSCSQKQDLLGLLGGMSDIRTKFLHAQFSPDGHVLVVSCSTTDASWTERTAAYVLFNSITYQILATLSVPLYTEPVKTNSQFNLSSLVCCKSYRPLFSQCGTKLGLISSPIYETLEQKRVTVHVYTVPVLMTLQSQCRITIRRCVKEQDISKLKQPSLLSKYLNFH